MSPVRHSSPRKPLLLTAAVGFALALSACGSSSSGSPSSTTASAVESESSSPSPVGPADLVLWSWTPDMQLQVDICAKANPGINIKLENAGTGTPQYEKLRTAIKADSGVPDIVHMAYDQIPGYLATNDLADLSQFGANDLKADYTASTWANVSRGDAVYALPWDSGPMGLLYREDILKQYDIAVPTTWAEFADAARKLHTADNKKFLTTFPPSDAGWFQALAWQAGSQPFKVSGSDMTVAINDANAKRVADYWDGLIKEGVVATEPDFTPDWYTALTKGKFATWVTAAWGPSFLQGVAEGSSGKWRAAPMPQWEAGQPASGEFGGSSLAVPAKSKNQAAAFQIVKCLMNGEESTKLFTTKQLLFPSKVDILNSPEFKDQKSDFYGGTAVNQTFVDASAQVVQGWEWSPIQAYVADQFSKEFGAAAAKGELSAALDKIQANVVQYATEQGFNVTAG
ncbi:MAG: extracellular solute-binding protein [Burkholderiales bacterium]